MIRGRQPRRISSNGPGGSLVRNPCTHILYHGPIAKPTGTTAAELAAQIAADPRARVALDRARHLGDLLSLARASRALERAATAARKKQLPRTTAQRRRMSGAQRLLARNQYAATANAMAIIAERLAEEYKTDIYTLIKDIRCRRRSDYILQLRRRFCIECRTVGISLPHIGRFLHRHHTAVLHILDGEPRRSVPHSSLSLSPLTFTSSTP